MHRLKKAYNPNNCALTSYLPLAVLNYLEIYNNLFRILFMYVCTHTHTYIKDFIYLQETQGGHESGEGQGERDRQTPY